MLPDTEKRLTNADVAKAESIWNDYQNTHDLLSLKGRAAGIDPETGRIWFGTNGLDIWRQRQSVGLNSPIFVVRIGSETYLRKGGRR